MENANKIDQDILIKVKKGDIGAFEELVSFFEKPVYNYCLRLSKNIHDARDITQDTFVKVYTKRSSIDPDKSIKTWIFTIATNTFYDIWRSRKRKNEVSLDFEDETINHIKAYYLEEGLVADVEQSLSEINTEYKNALLLFYRQGFSYEEIGEIMSVPINTVKTYIHRGKEQLKDKLKHYGRD